MIEGVIPSTVADPNGRASPGKLDSYCVILDLDWPTVCHE